jgi:hypothetical protein
MSSSSFGGIGGSIARTKEKKLENRAGSAKHSSRAGTSCQAAASVLTAIAAARLAKTDP